MRCQYCNCAESKVIDSRPTEEGNSIRAAGVHGLRAAIHDV